MRNLRRRNRSSYVITAKPNMYVDMAIAIGKRTVVYKSKKGNTMKSRPITTLLMLMSVDGKISPGASDDLDVDKDFPIITGLKEY